MIRSPVFGPRIPSLVRCSRCECCSLSDKAFCVGNCTPCGHHSLDDCPNCEDKEVEIRRLRNFIQDFVTSARQELYIS